MSLVIFLDIDGVLNNDPWLDKAGFGTLDPANVQMLIRLLQLVDADLVISSDWRTFYSYEELCHRLVSEGIPERFIGITPCLDVEGENDDEVFPRGLEIDAWLRNNNFDGVFCILDDRVDMEPHNDKLVQTDSHYGLVASDIAKAVSRLTCK
ncbi:MAG: HAD domain-containing protein [Phormidesmis sp.]